MIRKSILRDSGTEVSAWPLGRCRSEGRSFRPAVAAALILGLLFGLAAPVLVRAEASATHAAPALRTADLLALAELSKGFFESLPAASRLNVDEIVAFEENPRFVYLVGRTGKSRRSIVLIKPDTFVVEDRVPVRAAGTPVRYTLLAPQALEMDGRKFSVKIPEGELAGEALLPVDATLQRAHSPQHALEITAKTDGRQARFLQVLQVRRPDDERSGAGCELDHDENGWRLNVTTAALTGELTLPAEPDAAGTIAINAPDGRSLVARRLLPSGIMPHGEEGVKLLERWDTPYHDNRRPGWDTGRVAPELKKAVEKETTGRGRAIVLGCGSGTNAIHLAGKGFDVTGVDVAPAALTQAGKKAVQAGVDVRWIVADVLALPELEPFDLIFDRGCYHHVRQYNAAGYVESVRRLSHPGTGLLLLAGSANEDRRGGPPKIKEEEIRNDFSALFEFEWLREIRFDSRDPDAQGPLAWSVLLRRKGSK